MESDQNCKGCLASVRTSEDEIKQAIEKLARLKGMKFVDDTVYQKRLDFCRACRYLEYDTTCLQCGCIVQIKAKLPASYCPFPKDRKW